MAFTLPHHGIANRIACLQQDDRIRVGGGHGFDERVLSEGQRDIGAGEALALMANRINAYHRPIVCQHHCFGDKRAGVIDNRSLPYRLPEFSQ